jgi:hypothetical protein
VWTAQASPPGPVPGAVQAGQVPAGPAPPRRPRGDLRIITPVVHGLAASATILLALLTVVTAR